MANADALQALTQFDTPTICNALELIVPERRATGFTIQHMVCRDPSRSISSNHNHADGCSHAFLAAISVLDNDFIRHLFKSNGGCV